MKKLAAVTASILVSVVTYQMIYKNITASSAIQSLEGLWNLESAMCEDPSISQKLNQKIQQRDLKMRFSFHKWQFIETALEKDFVTSNQAGFRSVGTVSMDKESLVLAREKTEILRLKASFFHEWSKDDADRVKTFDIGLKDNKLVIATEDLCDGGKGRLQFVRM